MPTLAEIVDAVWLTEIQPGLTARAIAEAWLRYAEVGDGTQSPGGGWSDWDRIQRRDEAYDAIAAWKKSLAESTKFDEFQRLPNGGLPLANRGQRLPIGADASIDIDARIRAQQERRALAADTDLLQSTDAMTGNGLLLAAMLALLEDDYT